MNDITIVGEAWGEHEAIQKRPFVGPSGYELTRMLNEAGIDRGSCYLTNVINRRPPGNRIESLCDSREAGIVGYPEGDAKGLVLEPSHCLQVSLVYIARSLDWLQCELDELGSLLGGLILAW